MIVGSSTAGPRFSPDGRQIVFVASLPGDAGNSIRVVSVAGGEAEVVAAPGRVSSWWDTCWLPDGVSLVSSSQVTREPGLHRVDTRSHAVTPLTGAESLIWPVADISRIPRAGLSIAPWMGLAPDDTPLILRSRDTWEPWEPYALDWEAP